MPHRLPKLHAPRRARSAAIVIALAWGVLGSAAAQNGEFTLHQLAARLEQTDTELRARLAELENDRDRIVQALDATSERLDRVLRAAHRLVERAELAPPAAPATRVVADGGSGLAWAMLGWNVALTAVVVVYWWRRKRSEPLHGDDLFVFTEEMRAAAAEAARGAEVAP